VVLGRLFLIEGPLTRGQDFDVKLNAWGQGLEHGAVLEILG
jgi:hypothetical protein